MSYAYKCDLCGRFFNDTRIPICGKPGGNHNRNFGSEIDVCRECSRALKLPSIGQGIDQYNKEFREAMIEALKISIFCCNYVDKHNRSNS